MTILDIKYRKIVLLDIIYDVSRQEGRVWLRDVMLESFHRELISQEDSEEISLRVVVFMKMTSENGFQIVAGLTENEIREIKTCMGILRRQLEERFEGQSKVKDSL